MSVGLVKAAEGDLSDVPCARMVAFCEAEAPEIFQSIVHQPEIWRPDPHDVETIHAHARETFVRLLRRATTAPPPLSGRVLLLHGEAGSGKTHLLRAFRYTAHQDGIGYFGYLQMTTEAGNYGRYLLSNVIASLDQPYSPPQVQTSGLMRLATGLFESIPGLSSDERDTFRDRPDDRSIAEKVHEFADRAISDPRFAQCDVDVIQAMIYLQREDPRIKSKVLKWLRCEDLARYDREALGDLVPRTQEEHPLEMVSQLGRLMNVVHGASLVVCVDQLEDIFHQDLAQERFRKIVDALVALVDAVPTAVIVIACLEDYYTANRQSLIGSKLDRLERDPEPIRLTSGRSFAEIEALVARRLDVLYEEAGLSRSAELSTCPFRAEHLRPLTNLSARKVLDFCRSHHERCIVAREWVEPDFDEPLKTDQFRAAAQSPDFSAFEQAWNDFRSADTTAVPDDESKLAQLLAWGIARCNAELPAEQAFHPRQDDSMIVVEGGGPQSPSREFLVAVCERAPQGGGLAKQVAEVEKRASGLPVVLVRSTGFPKSPRSEISRQIGKLIGTRGRRVEVENADWRALLAFRTFCAARVDDPIMDAWQRHGRPLSRLPALQHVLALDRLPAQQRIAPPAPLDMPPAPPATLADELPVIADAPARTNSPSSGALLLGTSKGVVQAPVDVDPDELKQHMAFLGGSGSGKTTAALTLIDQLLFRGVPAIFVDRKGDLCRYADPRAWQDDDPVRAERLRQLRERVDVALFTPGSAGGRPLSIPIIPDGLSELSTADREQAAEFSAAAMGGMMGYRPRGNDQVQQVILAQALTVLSTLSGGRRISIDAVRELIDQQDVALLNVVGNGYDAKHYKKLAEDLLTLKLKQSRLLTTDNAEGAVESLDIDALLGRGPAGVAGKTRLSIINTQFIGAPAAVDFWVSQFLLALDRWRAKYPSDHLQAVVLLDEADLYLPAVSKPATKAPLESLLRRARSAGLGLMLATQSPGDLDYKCKENIRAWLVGRVKEPTALSKLKPMFSDARLDIGSKLPAQGTGEFYLLRERRVVAVKTDRSLIETTQLAEQRILELARLARNVAP